MNTKWLRWMGIYFLLDGLLTLLFGKQYIQLFRWGRRENVYRRMIDWLLDLPAWQVRAAGAAEAGLGLLVLSQAPVDVLTLYRQVAFGYAAIDPGWREWFYPQAHAAFDQALVKNLRQGADVLDLGSGVGANLSRLQAMSLPYASYTGVDLTDAMLQRAQNRYVHLPNVHFQPLNLLTDPLPEGPYDLIVSTWVFEHLPDPVKVAEKAWERLKPGGWMILLFEAQDRSLPATLTGPMYAFIGAHRVQKEEYRRFPGQAAVEQHFSGPLGDLALLVLQKPEGGNQG